ncbi:MAG: hypothetical protein U1G08_21295 [Verrucomicrobiota bacterium]
MSPAPHRAARAAAGLAINLLFLMIWGFAGIGKILEGVPSWFPDKFGKTLLATIPGLSATFWILTASEVLGFLLALGAILRAEFLGRRPATLLAWTLVWSLFVFLQLSLGLWLTADYTGTAQEFAYFAGTLVALMFILGTPSDSTPLETRS